LNRAGALPELDGDDVGEDGAVEALECAADEEGRLSLVVVVVVLRFACFCPRPCCWGAAAGGAAAGDGVEGVVEEVLGGLGFSSKYMRPVPHSSLAALILLLSRSVTN